MLVRSDGGIAWGLTLTSGVDEAQGPAPNWGAWPGAQIPQDSVSLWSRSRSSFSRPQIDDRSYHRAGSGSVEYDPR